MNLGNLLSGFIKKAGSMFAKDDFDIKNVDSLNNALNNIPNRGNTDNYDVMVVFNWIYSMAISSMGRFYLEFLKVIQVE